VEVDWKIYDKEDLETSETDFFKISVGTNPGLDKIENPYKLNF
jgi:hypothetical protein